MRIAYMVAVLACLVGCDRIPGTPLYKQGIGTAAVAVDMIDPDAAKFRNVRLVTRNGFESVCGEVNGKNRMGAYAGFRPFIVRLENDKPTLVNIQPPLNTDEGRVRDAQARCDRAREYPYSSSTASALCERAQSMRNELQDSVNFDGLLKLSC